eukprot:18248-Heterococcus_DN1.PRE.3
MKTVSTHVSAAASRYKQRCSDTANPAAVTGPNTIGSATVVGALEGRSVVASPVALTVDTTVDAPVPTAVGVTVATGATRGSVGRGGSRPVRVGVNDGDAAADHTRPLTCVFDVQVCATYSVAGFVSTSITAMHDTCSQQYTLWIIAWHMISVPLTHYKHVRAASTTANLIADGERYTSLVQQLAAPPGRALVAVAAVVVIQQKAPYQYFEGPAVAVTRAETYGLARMIQLAQCYVPQLQPILRTVAHRSSHSPAVNAATADATARAAADIAILYAVQADAGQYRCHNCVFRNSSNAGTNASCVCTQSPSLEHFSSAAALVTARPSTAVRATAVDVTAVDVTAADVTSADVTSVRI